MKDGMEEWQRRSRELEQERERLRVAYTDSEEGSSTLSTKTGRVTLGLGGRAPLVWEDSLERADTSIWLSLFNCSEKVTTNLLCAKWETGVNVLLLVDVNEAEKFATKRALMRMVRAGISCRARRCARVRRASPRRSASGSSGGSKPSATTRTRRSSPSRPI